MGGPKYQFLCLVRYCYSGLNIAEYSLLVVARDELHALVTIDFRPVFKLIGAAG